MHASRGRSQTLALGVWLAARGGLARVGLTLSALAALASLVVAVVGSGQLLIRLPTLTAYAVAWGAGVTVAFGGALHAVRRDAQEGILSLCRARGTSTASYVRGRVGGLVGVLAIAVGGPTLVAGMAATSMARPVLPVVHETVAGLAYALAFATTLGPVAMATLSARTRLGGYLALLSVLVLPELLAPWSAGALPGGWRELTSIPAALAAVSAGVASPATRGLHLARAVAALAGVVAASLLVVASRIPGVDAKDGA